MALAAVVAMLSGTVHGGVMRADTISSNLLEHNSTITVTGIDEGLLNVAL